LLASDLNDLHYQNAWPDQKNEGTKLYLTIANYITGKTLFVHVLYTTYLKMPVCKDID